MMPDGEQEADLRSAAAGADPSETVAELIRIFGEGSTSPALARTEAGEFVVVKFSGAGPGPRALITEALALRIAARLGVPVPSARKLYLPAGFPWQIGTDEFDDLVKRSAGWNLGVDFIAGARDLGSGDLEGLEPGFLGKVAYADRLLQNVDRTPGNPNLLVDPTGKLWAIDYGACLFLDRIVAGRTFFPFALPGNHLLAGTTYAAMPALHDPRHCLPDHLIADWTTEIPAPWLAGLPLAPAVLAMRLSGYVGAFATSLAIGANTGSEAPMPRSE